MIGTFDDFLEVSGEFKLLGDLLVFSETAKLIYTNYEVESPKSLQLNFCTLQIFTVPKFNEN